MNNSSLSRVAHKQRSMKNKKHIKPKLGCVLLKNKIQELSDMKLITVAKLKEWRDNKKEYQLIDVRELGEYQISNLGGKLVPLGYLTNHLPELNEATPVVMLCRSGGRSSVAVSLAERYNEKLEVYNLEGGMKAWKEYIDPTIEVG